MFFYCVAGTTSVAGFLIYLHTKNIYPKPNGTKKNNKIACS
jgi:hypothetical protein